MQPRFDYDVFLSHASKDKTVVRRLAERLRASGLRVWFDERSIEAGDEIYLEIHKGQIASRRIVACWSRAYFESAWGRAESLNILFFDPTNSERRFIPVLLADCEPPYFFRRFKFVDYRTESETAFLELLAACSPLSPEPDVVQPLHVTEDRFLQALLFQFSLRRNTESAPNGVELRVYFDDFTPTIWNSQGKRHLLARLSKRKRKSYQRKLDDFLLRGKKDAFDFNDAEFLFRYASAGTLPIITFVDDKKPKHYYCLFYRDVYPIGWNIANGGCDNRAELLNPEITMERELSEELIIADFEKETRYVFDVDAPAHKVARWLWAEKHKVLDLDTLKTREVPIECNPGPDSLHIQFGNETIPPRRGFYLNINAEDFGIEVDRIATIRLSGRPILFDGELEGSWLVNSPVGLFEVEKLNRQFCKGKSKKSFRPDFFFFDAKRYPGRKIDQVLDEFAKHVCQFRSPEEIKEFRSSIEKGAQYGLCPVTARIIERHLQATGRL